MKKLIKSVDYLYYNKVINVSTLATSKLEGQKHIHSTGIK